MDVDFAGLHTTSANKAARKGKWQRLYLFVAEFLVAGTLIALCVVFYLRVLGFDWYSKVASDLRWPALRRLLESANDAMLS